jgi:hypothetical protein
MSGVFVLILIFVLAARYVVAGGRLVFKPARPALWVGSSYWGTRNCHTPTGHTPLDTVDKFNDPDSSRRAFWLSGMAGSGSACPSTIPARQSQGVTADFWYPSMRRATPATVAQRRPTQASKFRHHRPPQQFNKNTVKGENS